MKRMTEIINSLPRGAQKELAKEFNIDKSYVSAVLNGEKKPSQTGLHIQEKAIEIAVKEIAKKMEERLKKKYLVTNNNSIKETELMVTVELKSTHQIKEVIRKYENNGWKYHDRGCCTRHEDKLRVTIEFRKKSYP